MMMLMIQSIVTKRKNFKISRIELKRFINNFYVSSKLAPSQSDESGDIPSDGFESLRK